MMAEQLDVATRRAGAGDLDALLAGNDTWTVEPTGVTRSRRSSSLPLSVVT